ncbi:glycosyltransferase family 2 protein [Alteromonas sp. ASW11-36]|uniref:Glycosyltransferase family 2 protein n=1 Tax=Alteromonas arenosi TaxID=3055817 RepID=A0ABT7T0R8_9ALTE|nr:glycosyltransferase family 2 protein [Alteromonas sp. ASW11-36]MDM7861407.1 glycosyltransferase family 2 protein [Alteromonas sp. ASW11-36]
MSNQPVQSITISIVVPYYNASDCLERLFVSLADYAQREDIEMIIVDDCSAQQHAQALDEYAAKKAWPRLTVVHCEQNGGAAKARKTAIEYAMGEYIAFLDSDDAWALNKLDSQLAAMRASSAVISGCACEQIDLASLEQRRQSPAPEYQAIPYSPWRAMFGNAYSTPTVMVRREIANAHPFSDTLRYSEDVDCWRRIVLHHGGIVLQQPNAFMFKHAFLSDEGSLSSFTFKMSLGQLKSLAGLILHPTLKWRYKLCVPLAMVWAAIKGLRREWIVWRHRRRLKHGN